jgi:hypothetical protein
VPHFFSDFLACLNHKYLSLNIEQLLEVFDGIEEQAEMKINIINDELIFKIFI